MDAHGLQLVLGGDGVPFPKCDLGHVHLKGLFVVHGDELAWGVVPAERNNNLRCAGVDVAHHADLHQLLFVVLLVYGEGVYPLD